MLKCSATAVATGTYDVVTVRLHEYFTVFKDTFLSEMNPAGDGGTLDREEVTESVPQNGGAGDQAGPAEWGFCKAAAPEQVSRGACRRASAAEVAADGRAAQVGGERSSLSAADVDRIEAGFKSGCEAVAASKAQPATGRQLVAEMGAFCEQLKSGYCANMVPFLVSGLAMLNAHARGGDPAAAAAPFIRDGLGRFGEVRGAQSALRVRRAGAVLCR